MLRTLAQPAIKMVLKNGIRAVESYELYLCSGFINKSL
jgi:hypothetical protein